MWSHQTVEPGRQASRHSAGVKDRGASEAITRAMHILSAGTWPEVSWRGTSFLASADGRLSALPYRTRMSRNASITWKSERRGRGTTGCIWR